MSLSKEILRVTARFYPMGYTDLYEHLYGETVYGKKINRNSLRVILSRMKGQGLLIKDGGRWAITREGRKALAEDKKPDIKKFFQSGRVRNQSKIKKLMVIFDIPEKRKAYREWLRSELVGFGFTMIQKSVWLGHALPKEFMQYLDEIKLLRHLRFFRVDERDLI